jgi:hypothetical protein
MKIAIIGGGWLGCHIGLKLKELNHTITLFEKSEIFSGSSFYNSNRLHRGFHYSRNKKTRELCYNTFDLFLEDYKEIVEDVENNHYAIPIDNSLIDFGTFKTIFNYEKVPFTEIQSNYLTNIEGCVVVDEKYINPLKAKLYFSDKLSNNTIIKDITENDLEKLSIEYDYVINTTNNHLNVIKDCYFELSIALIYDKFPNSSFGSLTFVDGPLFSIYPYQFNSYNITDVEYTPLFVSNNIKDINKHRDNITQLDVNAIKDKIERKIKNYYTDFNSTFSYTGYYTAIKVKRKSVSADRYPVIQKEGNIISCFTGKIQGIYILEKYIKNEIINR